MNRPINDNTEIRIGDISVPLVVMKGQPMRVKLSFDDQPALVIETGSGHLKEFDRKFITKKLTWIAKQYQLLRRQNQFRQEFLSNLERQILLLGEITPVEFIDAPNTRFTFFPQPLFSIQAPARYFEPRRKELLFHALREFAKNYLSKKTKDWAEICKLEVNQIRVKDHQSKWGSCSSLKNINLNWQLIFLGEDLIDYVVVHELMHLHEMNHSKAFWTRVGNYYPDYQQARKKLKEKQWVIGILK